MAMFALAVTPMVRDLWQHHADIQQCWYADYGEAGGRLWVVHAFWRDITSLGPQYGHNPNAAKTKLLVKPGLAEEARILFADTPIDIRSDGARYLGGAIGTQEYITGSL